MSRLNMARGLSPGHVRSSQLGGARDERLAREQPLEAAHAPVRPAVVREQRRHAAHARSLRVPADRTDSLEALRRVGGGNGAIRIELDAVGGARELAIRGDVLALAEERLVERVLEVAQPTLLAGPEACGEG